MTCIPFAKSYTATNPHSSRWLQDDEHYFFEGEGKPHEHKDALSFFKGVADGTITARYEGTYGMPDR
jgi:hypothetical protein